MGEQLSGRALNYQEIQANGHRIRSISNQHLIRKFREIKQDSDFPRIYDAGIEAGAIGGKLLGAGGGGFILFYVPKNKMVCF